MTRNMKIGRVGGQGKVEVGKEQGGREERIGRREGVDGGTPPPILLPSFPQLVRGKGRKPEEKWRRQRGERRGKGGHEMYARNLRLVYT